MEKKLSLKKKTISSLHRIQLDAIKGGYPQSCNWDTCPGDYYKKTNYSSGTCYNPGDPPQTYVYKC